jgi:hypothetical protein
MAHQIAELGRELADLCERHDALLEEIGQFRGERSSPTLGECSDFLLTLCDEHGGDNFGTWTVWRDKQRWVMTIQRVGGETPDQELRRAQGRIAELEREVADRDAFLLQCDQLCQRGYTVRVTRTGDKLIPYQVAAMEMLNATEEHVLKLEAEIATLRADKERLDWLDENANPSIENANPSIHCPCDEGTFDLRWAHATNYRIRTLREAIDAARRGEG